MPIRPENLARYPADWPAISLRIRERDGWRCVTCGLKNYSLGGRTENGTWLDAAPIAFNGVRETWPEEGAFSWCGPPERPRWLRIVRIVLTVAHLDHTPENCSDDNLRSLCQRCHNLYDAPMRRAGILARARAALGMSDLFGS